MSVAELLPLLALFGGAIAAVWKLLSLRIQKLEDQIQMLVQKNLEVLDENSKIRAERDVGIERLADIRQQLTVTSLQRDKLWEWLDKALDLRTAPETLANIRLKAEQFFEPEKGDKPNG